MEYTERNYVYRDFSPVFNNGSLARYQDDYNLDAIKNSLINIFTIQQNDCPGKPDFGNPLQRDTFDLFDSVSEATLFSAIQNAIEKWEPRVTVQNLNVSLLPELNRIVIDLRYEAIVNDIAIVDNLMIPFSHNNFTFMNGRASTDFVSKLATQ